MIYILAEGHGEVDAACKLVNKIWANLNLPYVPVGKAIRWQNLHLDAGIKKGIEFIKTKRNVQGLVILRDDEDNCPKDMAPAKSKFIKSINADFPISYNIMYREFETLFVAYLDYFKGKTINHLIRGTITFSEDISTPLLPESIRDAKKEIFNSIIGNFKYNPTTDQLTLTQELDINLLRAKNLPCFGSLERGIIHIANNIGKNSVYP